MVKWLVIMVGSDALIAVKVEKCQVRTYLEKEKAEIEEIVWGVGLPDHKSCSSISRALATISRRREARFIIGASDHEARVPLLQLSQRSAFRMAWWMCRAAQRSSEKKSKVILREEAQAAQVVGFTLVTCIDILSMFYAEVEFLEEVQLYNPRRRSVYGLLCLEVLKERNNRYAQTRITACQSEPAAYVGWMIEARHVVLDLTDVQVRKSLKLAELYYSVVVEGDVVAVAFREFELIALVMFLKVKITFVVGKEAITFNWTNFKHTQLITTYDCKQIDVIEYGLGVAYYSQRVLGIVQRIAEWQSNSYFEPLFYCFSNSHLSLPVIIAKDLKDEEKAALLKVLKSHKRAIAWKLSDIKGVNPEFCTHKILMEEDYEPSVQSQRRVNPKIHDVIKKEVEKLLDAGLIYPISDSPWVSPVHCVPKKGGMTVITNDENELIPTRLVTGWRGGSHGGERMSHFYGEGKEGIVLGHKISKSGIEVDRAKVEVIAKLPHPTTVKGVRSFLGHAGFYRNSIRLSLLENCPSMIICLGKRDPFFFSKV
ncbi:hypothetical protein Tco_1195809 [Tanacetum coccineum]